jgi:hypothetical protein
MKAETFQNQDPLKKRNFRIHQPLRKDTVGDKLISDLASESAPETCLNFFFPPEVTICSIASQTIADICTCDSKK